MAAEIKAIYEGKWKHYKNENYEPYLDACGLEPFERNLAVLAKPVIKLTVNGEEITSKVKSGPIKNKVTFKLDQEYEHTFLGNKFKVLATWSGGKFKSNIKPQDPKRADQYTEREVINGELVVTLEAKGVRAKQYYKKVETSKSKGK